MNKRSLLRLFAIPLVSGAAWAQNFDMFYSAGPAWSHSRTLNGSGVTLAAKRGYSFQINYGFQVARASAASLLVDMAYGFSIPGNWEPNVPVSGPKQNSFRWITAGLRLMIPLHSRLSVYPVAAGGPGFFRAATVNHAPETTLSIHSTTHGLFSFGGGADIRLTRLFSIRAEIRDYVTGRELSGVSGRHHAVPLIGIAMHR